MTTSGVSHTFTNPLADAAGYSGVKPSHWNDDHTIVYVKPSGLTGATAASRYVGATTSGAPSSGTFAVGDFIIDQTGSVWVCSSAGTPGTWQQVGGANANEAKAGALTNATSTGDSGNRADHFLGTSLSGSWTAEGAALTTGPLVKYSSLAVIGTAGQASQVTQAYTPSGACRAEVRMRMVGDGSTGMGAFIRDSNASVNAGEGEYLWYDGNTQSFQAYKMTSGTSTQQGSNSGFIPAVSGTTWVYLAVEQNGSNQWKYEWSIDRNLWTTVTSGVSHSFTIAKGGFRLFNNKAIFADFFDVVT